MKRLILIKQSPAIQLGHLYEHIFCASIDELFHSYHLYPRVDYTLFGKMYHGGVLVLDIELYTTAAIRLVDKILSLDITFSESNIKSALSQIIAEREEPMGSKGYDAIVSALRELQSQPWQTIDDVAVIDVKKLRRVTGPIYSVDGKRLPARKLKTSVVLDGEFTKSHRELLPLFREITSVIIETWQSRVANKFGYFSYDNAFRDTTKQTAATNIFSVPNIQDATIDLNSVMEICRETLNDLLQNSAIERYREDLNNVSYMTNSNSAPSYEKNYEDTLLFVGAKGWQQIATKANCDLLLNNIRIEVVFGSKQVTGRV